MKYGNLTIATVAVLAPLGLLIGWLTHDNHSAAAYRPPAAQQTPYPVGQQIAFNEAVLYPVSMDAAMEQWSAQMAEAASHDGVAARAARRMLAENKLSLASKGEVAEIREFNNRFQAAPMMRVRFRSKGRPDVWLHTDPSFGGIAPEWRLVR